MLDQSNVTHLAARASSGTRTTRRRIWGLHNYKDVNRHQSKGLTNVLKTVPGEVWLTETGGITKFAAPGFKTSPSRAASATKYMFQLADRFDSKKKGYKSKVTRIYVYRWWGEPRRHVRLRPREPGRLAAPGVHRSSRSTRKHRLK